jgi:hypothetical protein
VFGNRILKNEYDFDFAFFKNKSYFVQLFKKQIIFYLTFSKQILFYSTFSKKSNFKIHAPNKN